MLGVSVERMINRCESLIKVGQISQRRDFCVTIRFRSEAVPADSGSAGDPFPFPASSIIDAISFRARCHVLPHDDFSCPFMPPQPLLVSTPDSSTGPEAGPFLVRPPVH
jgi:hypothetical protein